MIRVAVIDDQTLVRQGLVHLLTLAPGVQVVGQAADGAAGLDLIEQSKPDVALVDVRMPGMDGLEMLAELHRRSAPVRTVMITTFDDDAAVLRAAELGAKGFLLKDATLDELLAAIRAAAEGKTFLRPAVTARVLDALREGLRTSESERLPTRTAEPAPDLTARELEVLRLMAGGYSNREIAGALDAAEGTIKNHVSSVLAKMGVRDRTRAVLKALDLGLI